MTRATLSRIEQRLKRKGDIAPHRKGYADGWAAGRLQLANALASPGGFKAVDGRVFRLAADPSRLMVMGDIYDADCTPWPPVSA